MSALLARRVFLLQKSASCRTVSGSLGFRLPDTLLLSGTTVTFMLLMVFFRQAVAQIFTVVSSVSRLLPCNGFLRDQLFSSDVRER